MIVLILEARTSIAAGLGSYTEAFPGDGGVEITPFVFGLTGRLG